MPTRIEEYMDELLAGPVDAYSGFLGAYNMGVWGVSVSGKAALQPGLATGGTVRTSKPRFTIPSPNNPRAQNYVAYYDTPSLWGFGDEKLGMDSMLHSAIVHACGALGISMEGGLTETETKRVQKFLKTRSGMNWNGILGGDLEPWSEVATTTDIQLKMDQVGAWSKLVSRWKAVIAQSRYLVDITSLSPPVTNSEVQIAICDGIVACIKNWIRSARQAKENGERAPRLMIRLMFGMTVANAYFTGQNTYWSEFKTKLSAALAPLRWQIQAIGADNPPIVLYGSDMGKRPAAFNHSKIVAGDGQYAVVGGHNMCEEVSSNRAPVIHDVTCEVTGPGAKTANAFAGSLWIKAAESGRLYIHRFDWDEGSFEDLSTAATKLWAPNNTWYYHLGDQEEVQNVIENQYWYYPMQNLPVEAEFDPPGGSVPAAAIMGIGRWGDTQVFGVDGKNGLKLNTAIGNEFACHYASDTLKRLMIGDKKNTLIAMTQQDLVNAGKFGGLQSSEHTICEAIANRLRATPTGTAIQVVVSSRFTQNSEGLAYSYGDGPREGIERISDTLAGEKHASSPKNDLPQRLAILSLSANPGVAPVHYIESSSSTSFCTVAPLTFCHARGTTRNRGSYVWPGVKYQGGLASYAYANARFWNTDDGNEKGFGPGNHAKVIMVSQGDDDSTGLVMIGSDNMYPSPLSEFNLVIEGQEAIAAFRAQIWDRLWGYSARMGFTVTPDGNVV